MEKKGNYSFFKSFVMYIIYIIDRHPTKNPNKVRDDNTIIDTDMNPGESLEARYIKAIGKIKAQNRYITILHTLSFIAFLLIFLAFLAPIFRIEIKFITDMIKQIIWTALLFTTLSMTAFISTFIRKIDYKVFNKYKEFNN